MSERLHWVRDGADWPNRDASRRVDAGGLRWHVQVMGRGPALLLVHGTGAATNSWRTLAPPLARHFTVIAPDLPGHGFSDPVPREHMSLPAIAQSLSGLLKALHLEPAIAAGHSAGAAIVARMSLDGHLRARTLLGINAAMLPLSGLPGLVFPPMARLLCSNSLAARLFAWRARDRSAVERLVRETGSALDPEGVDLYARLLRSPGHAAAALDMMASWDLAPLRADLPRLTARLVLARGTADRTLAPDEADRIRALAPGASVVELEGLGHLSHEEHPGRFVEILIDIARTAGVIDAPAPYAKSTRRTAWRQPVAV